MGGRVEVEGDDWESVKQGEHSSNDTIDNAASRRGDANNLDYGEHGNAQDSAGYTRKFQVLQEDTL